MAIKLDWQQQIREIKENHRLRLGVWGIFFTALLYACLVMSDLVTEQQSEFAQNSEQLVRLEALKSNNPWSERLKGETALAKRLKARLWQADTTGLAQAQLQAEIQKLTKTSGLRNVRLKLGAVQEIAEAPGVWRVQLELNAKFDAESVEQLLIDLESLKHAVAIEHFFISADRGNRINLLLSAFFADIKGQANG